MAQYIKIPHFNPVRIFRADTGSFAVDLLPDHEVRKDYCQKFQNDDFLTLQFQAATPINFIEAYLIRSDLSIAKTLTVTQKFWQVISAFTVAEINEQLTGLAEGIYYLLIKINPNLTNEVQFYSEPIYIKAIHEGTMLIKYYNDENEFDVIFDSNNSPLINFFLRVEGGFSSDGLTPGSKDTVYTNQIFNKKLLSSIPYATKKITFGNAYGIPNWMVELINGILSHNHIFINNKQYNKFDGAKLEPARIDRFYPFASWVIEMIDSENKYSDEVGLINVDGLDTVLGYDENVIGFDSGVLGY